MDATREFADRISRAASSRTVLCIRGGGTKDFYGGPLRGELLDTRGHRGVIAYEPSELYITARCGTPLSEIEALLAEHNQMLAFEPPHFGPGATLGGCVAAGLCGPRRASAGGLRDFVLGVVLIDGRGEVLRFGGQVMKNVAGFDVSRLMSGAMGTLGLMLEITLKVLPRPQQECTPGFDFDNAAAVLAFNRWAGQPLPISASSASHGRAHVRLSGAASAIDAARRLMGGECIAEAAAALHLPALREHSADDFLSDVPLWRMSVPSVAPVAEGQALIEWGGALRWGLGATPLPGATRFRGGDRQAAVIALAPPMFAVQSRLRAAFDPAGIFNPDRLPIRPHQG